jgi:Co/Zn/Cd efflux system component
MALAAAVISLIVLAVLAAIALGVFLFIFWILMIVDCAKRDFKNENEKIVWIIVIVLAGWIGALIYYFAVKSNSDKKNSRRK